MDGLFRVGERPRRLQDLAELSESGLFAAAVSVMLGWREVQPFQTSVAWKLGGDAVMHFKLKATPAQMQYQLHNLDTGDLERYDGWAHEMTFNSEPQVCSVNTVNPEAPATRLTFPMSLGVWGRPGDDYALTGEAAIEDDLVRLELVHITDDALRGALFVSAPLSMAVKMETPTQSIWYGPISWE